MFNVTQRFGLGYVTKSPANRKGLKGGFSKALEILAEGPGFEPGFTESESIPAIAFSSLKSITI
jgi:hypothetical protein